MGTYPLSKALCAIVILLGFAAGEPAHARAKKKKKKPTPQQVDKKPPPQRAKPQPQPILISQDRDPDRPVEIAPTLVIGENEIPPIVVHCAKTEAGDDFMKMARAKSLLDSVCFPAPKKSFDDLDWMVKDLKPKTTSKECKAELRKEEKKNSPWAPLKLNERLTRLQQIIGKTRFPEEEPYRSLAFKTLLPCMAAVESGTLEPLSVVQDNCSDGDWQTSRGLFHVNAGTIKDLMERKGSDGKPLMRGLLPSEQALSPESMHDVLAGSIPLQVRISANALAEKYRTARRLLGTAYPNLTLKALEFYNTGPDKEYYARGVLGCAARLKKSPHDTKALDYGHCTAHPPHPPQQTTPPLADWMSYCQCLQAANTPKKESECKAQLDSATKSRVAVN